MVGGPTDTPELLLPNKQLQPAREAEPHRIGRPRARG